MSNRLFQMSLIGLVAIGVLSIIVFVFWNIFSSEQMTSDAVQAEPELTLEEEVDLRVHMDSITTNLYTNEYIIVEFILQVNREEAVEELDKRMPEIRSSAISLLASKTPEDLRGDQGIRAFEQELQERINEILTEGRVIRIYTYNRQLQ